MRHNSLPFWRLVCLLLMLVSCRDEWLQEQEISTEIPSDALVLDGSGHTFTLPVNERERISQIEITEGDFLVPVGKETLYVEQNDGTESRMAQVSVAMSDHRQLTFTLVQPPATKSQLGQLRRSFYRHYGLGYSYDALNGDYCDLSSVRCQVMNRAVIDYIDSIEVEPFIRVDRLHQMYAKSSVSTSVVDYVQNTNFSSSVSGSILLYQGGVKNTCRAFEDGSIDTYILHEERHYPQAAYAIEVAAIASYAEKYPQLLTSSFRASLTKLAATSANDWRAVDEFIATYGTHVVYAVELGAKLAVDVQVETHKFSLEVKEETLAQNALGSLFKQEGSSSAQKKNYQVLRDNQCRVEVLGGDVSQLDAVIGMTTFSNEHVTNSMLEAWEQSIYYSDEDLEHSNAEMTHMEVVPIWELIPDQTVAERVEARIMSDAAAMQHLLGNRNFLNTRFPYPVREVTCRIGTEKATFQSPKVVDILALGRYVASVCQEYVPEITTKEPVTVAYPIYEGRIKLTNGYCIYQGTAYRVDWRHGQFAVTALGKVDCDGYLYLNCGAISASRYTNITYQPGYALLGCERPGGIATDGSLAGHMVKVQKHFGHFYLQDDKARYNNLPGWDFLSKPVEEASVYSPYFQGDEWQNRMVRKEDYTYIYNQTEIGYE